MIEFVVRRIYPDFDVNDLLIVIANKDLTINADYYTNTSFGIQDHESRNTSSPVICDMSVIMNVDIA